MDAIAEVGSRKGIRAWVQFETRTVENKEQSEKQGKFVGLDKEFVIITPPYGKDNVHQEVPDWIRDMKDQVAQGRLGDEDRQYYLRRYQSWKEGRELPLEGTPILGWGVIGEAQQKMLISVGIRTVEALADINDEGVARVGMGAKELKRKATAWVAQLQDKGPLTQKMAAVEKDNENLRTELATMRTQLAQLQDLVKQQPSIAIPSQPIGVTAADLIDEEPPKKKR